MEAGDELPELKVTPDRYLTVPLRGRVGRLQPDPHRRGVRRSVGLPGRILHGLWTMAQVARAQTEAAGGPRQARASPSSSAGWACPSRRSSSPPRCARSPTASRSWTPRPSRPAPASSGTARRRSPPPRTARVLTPRQELILRKVVEGYSATGQPVGSKALAADPEVDWGPSTIRNELAVLEERGLLAHPHTSAGRVPTDAGYRYFVDRLLPARAVRRDRCDLTLARREVDEAMRADERDAVAGHQPAGDRLRAADRHRDDPPRRGPGAAAAGADGRGHHLDRRRDQARVHLRAARGPRPRRLGRVVPQRGAGRAWASARARCARASPTRRWRRPSARSSRTWRPRSPSWRRPPRTRCTSTARRGCWPSTASRTSPRSTS